MLRPAAAVLALSLLVGCSGDPASPEAQPPTSLATEPFPRETSTSTTELPAVVAWQPTPNEPVPEVKVAAARAVEALLTYDAGSGTPDDAAGRVAELGLPAQLAVDVAPLLVDGASRAEVIYPQLGGLTDTAASVMTVVRITVEADEGQLVTTRTVDVRLERTPAGWRAATLASLGSAPEATAAPSSTVLSLLDSGRLDLPDSAVWDLQAGFVDQRVIDLLLDLANDYDLGVAVIASGHPVNVFDRDVTSNHTVGRGVDIWSVDGTPVAEQQQDPVLRAVVDRALAMGATEVGAPFDTDGPRGKVFTNTVHKDHLHLAFDAPPATTTTSAP